MITGYQFSPTRLANILKSDNSKVLARTSNHGNSYTNGRNMNRHNSFGRKLVSFTKTKHVHSLLPSYSPSRLNPRKSRPWKHVQKCSLSFFQKTSLFLTAKKTRTHPMSICSRACGSGAGCVHSGRRVDLPQLHASAWSDLTSMAGKAICRAQCDGIYVKVQTI